MQRRHDEYGRWTYPDHWNEHVDGGHYRIGKANSEHIEERGSGIGGLIAVLVIIFALAAGLKWRDQVPAAHVQQTAAKVAR
jgi:hypothetical protein